MNRANYNEYMRGFRKRTYTPGCDFNKDRNLRHKYGISLEQLQEMIVDQGGMCALCDEPLDLTPSVSRYASPVVDHDHKCCAGSKSCGKCIRGVIHRSCNIGLGAFEDSSDKLRLAVAYLEKDQ